MSKSEKLLRRGIVLASEVLATATIVSLINSSDGERLLLAFATVLFVLVPEILERLFRCKVNTSLYIAAVLYALGPMMGHCWKFYYTVPYWDKILHVCGGVVFAILGHFLFQLVSGESTSRLSSALFALTFSLSIAMIWEFMEYGADVLLGMDMQADTVISGINSYLLGPEKGLTGSIGPIRSVVINGSALPVDGYLDVGLHDTMLDMMLESIGAALTCVIIYLSKKEHFLIQPSRRKDNN